jgi:RNA-binding protein YlmH
MNIRNILQHYPQEQKDFIMRTMNAFEDVNNKDIIRNLGFCEPNMLDIINDLSVHFSNVIVKQDGGYDNAEKKKVIIFPNYYGDVSTEVCVYEVVYSNKFSKLEHRQVLGTILNNGFDFTRFGDIIVDENGIVQIVIDQILAETLPFIVEKIANQNVKFKEIPEVTIVTKELQDKMLRSKSLRIDSIVKVITKSSRVKGQQLIQSKLVKLNYNNVVDITKTIQENDIISIRGYGRYTIGKITMTSKGNYNIIYR